MRKVLLAGVAVGAVSTAMMVASPARADDAPAVFPVTSETDLAGWNGPSLNGAAPGSVQVNLGGRTFSAIYFQNKFLNGTPNWAKSPEPQLMYYFFLYPGFDYASPSGIHFGAQAEIRVTNASQASSLGGNDAHPFFHLAYTYVSSATFGKVQFGIPPGALVQNAVGTGDDFGTGIFFSWYNTGVPWVMGDAPDNYNGTEKVVYTTPTFAGFNGAVSWQPTDVGLNYSDGLTVGQAPGGTVIAQRNRIELAAKYSGTFGPVGFKVNGGYVWSGTEKSGDTKIAQDVSYGNVGAQFNIAGFELEGSGSVGKFNAAITGFGNPDGPLPLHAKNTKAFVLGGGYGAGPFKVGAAYYHVSYDDADFGGPLNRTGYIRGEGLGAAYTVGPGVVAYLDATIASMNEFSFDGVTFAKQHPKGLGVGTFFTW